MTTLLLFVCLIGSVVGNPSKLTIDHFFNGTAYTSVILSPNGEYVLVATQRASWKSSTYETTLWLYQTSRFEQKWLITDELSASIQPRWSPTSNWFLFSISEKNSNKSNGEKVQERIHLYDVRTGKLLTIEIGNETLSAITWFDQDTMLYFATIITKSTAEDPEWQDVVRYGQVRSRDRSRIQRLEIREKNGQAFAEINPVHTVDFLIAETVYSSSKNQLILKTVSSLIENLDVLELYSIDLNNVSTLQRLTNNEDSEANLQISKDGQMLFFQTFPFGSKYKPASIHQPKLYSINLANGRTEQWAADFDGSIDGYSLRPEDGVYYVGQKSIFAKGEKADFCT